MYKRQVINYNGNLQLNIRQIRKAEEGEYNPADYMPTTDKSVDGIDVYKRQVYMYTFIVTNMDSSPEYLIKFYCKRGLMENFIKESKSGFDFASVSLSLIHIL